MSTNPEVNYGHRRFVSELLKGKTNKAAAVAAGYHPDHAKDLIKMDDVQNLLHKALNDAGIDDQLIARKLREGLDAKTPPRKDGGRQYPDQFVRKQFLDVIFKLRGDYAPEKSENVTKTINVTIDKGWIAALKDTQYLDSAEIGILEAEIIRENDATEERDGRLRQEEGGLPVSEAGDQG